MTGIKFREPSREPLVSIVIPTRNSGGSIETCLKSVRKQTYPNIEVILVDNYSTDDTREVAEKLGAEISVAKARRSEARNIGLEKATGGMVFFVDADMELDFAVVQRCVEKVGDGCDAVMIPEVSVGQGFWANCKALEKACYVGDDTIEAARFFKRSVFESIGGYDTELEAGEDWDLNQRIRKAGFGIGRINTFITHHEGRLGLRETLMKKHHYGKTIGRYRKKHPEEARQQVRLIRYAFIRNWTRLAKDPIHALGMALMKACEFAVAWLGSLGNSEARDDTPDTLPLSR